MTNEPFTYAVADRALRAEIAFALDAREATATELAELHGISEATIRRYAAEADADRRLHALPDHIRGAMIASCRAGNRRRWERRYGRVVVAAVLARSWD